MAKKLILGPILTHLAQIWAANIFLDIVTRYHPIQFKGKLRNQTWENGKKTHFGPDFGPFWPKFGSQKKFMDFTSTRCTTLLQDIIVLSF